MIDNIPPVLQQLTTQPHLLGPASFEHPHYDEGPSGNLQTNKDAACDDLETLLTRMKAKFGDFTPIKGEEFRDKLRTQIQQSMQDLDAQFKNFLQQLETTTDRSNKPASTTTAVDNKDFCYLATSLIEHNYTELAHLVVQQVRSYMLTIHITLPQPRVNHDKLHTNLLPSIHPYDASSQNNDPGGIMRDDYL
jgi:hypothetical protein